MYEVCITRQISCFEESWFSLKTPYTDAKTGKPGCFGERYFDWLDKHNIKYEYQFNGWANNKEWAEGCSEKFIFTNKEDAVAFKIMFSEE